MDDYPNNYIVVMHQTGTGQTAWGNQRRNFYNLTYTPWLEYDGLQEAWPINTYRSKFLVRQAVPTDVTIEMEGVETGVQTYELTAEVCIEPSGVGKTMRIYMVDTLDHFPTWSWYYRNGFRQAAATEDLAVAAGECKTVTREFVFDATSWATKRDIHIVAWAQEPLNSGPAEVYQAAQSEWPFFIEVGFFEADYETGDFAQWARTSND